MVRCIPVQLFDLKHSRLSLDFRSATFAWDEIEVLVQKSNPRELCFSVSLIVKAIH